MRELVVLYLLDQFVIDQLIITKVKSGDGGLIVDELPHCDHINHTYIADFGIHYMDSKLLDTSFINSIEFTQ